MSRLLHKLCKPSKTGAELEAAESIVLAVCLPSLDTEVRPFRDNHLHQESKTAQTNQEKHPLRFEHLERIVTLSVSPGR